MRPLPNFSPAEYRAVCRALPPPVKTRSLDPCRIVLALAVREAHHSSIAEAAELAGVNASTVRVARSRWQRDGILPAIMAAAEPAIERLRRERHVAHGHAQDNDLLEQLAKVLGF
jgi:transposase-like protein